MSFSKSDEQGRSAGSIARAWLPVRRVLAVATAATLVLLAVPTAAHADTVSNNVVAGGSPTITAGSSTSIGYSIQNVNNNGGDPENSCNAKSDSPAKLTVSVPAGVTVSPASRDYTSCGTTQFFEFSSTTLGSHTITVTVGTPEPVPT